MAQWTVVNFISPNNKDRKVTIMKTNTLCLTVKSKERNILEKKRLNKPAFFYYVYLHLEIYLEKFEIYITSIPFIVA